MSDKKTKTKAMTTAEKPQVNTEADKNGRSEAQAYGIWLNTLSIYLKNLDYTLLNSNVPIGTTVPKGTEQHFHPAFCGTF
jgi:hypothetical protein